MKELLKYLRKESNSRSYSRGLQYYNSGAVDSVEQKGNTFIGIVEGSDTYQRETPNFEQIISPILSIYPLDSFDIIRQNVYNLLDKDQSRTACKKVCQWLKLMQQIKGFEKETKVFINYMYEAKIPTLKNEMVLANFFGW